MNHPLLRLRTLLFAALALLLAACGTAPAPAISAASAKYEMGIQDSGGSYRVRRGDILVIRLAGNPSTGAVWEYTELNRALLKEISARAYEPPPGPVLPGEGITLVFALRAEQPGLTSVKMAYRRPWRSAEVWGRFEITVQVDN